MSKVKPITDYSVEELKEELDGVKVPYKTKDTKAVLYGLLKQHYKEETPEEAAERARIQAEEAEKARLEAEAHNPQTQVQQDGRTPTETLDQVEQNAQASMDQNGPGANSLGQQGENRPTPAVVPGATNSVGPTGLEDPNASRISQDVVNPQNVPNHDQPTVYDNNSVEVLPEGVTEDDVKLEYENSEGVLKAVFSQATHGQNWKKLADEYAVKTGYRLRQVRSKVDPTLAEFRIKQALLDRLAGLTAAQKLEEIEKIEAELVQELGAENLAKLKKSLN